MVSYFCGCNFYNKVCGTHTQKNAKYCRFCKESFGATSEQNQAYLSHGTDYPLQIFCESSYGNVCAKFSINFSRQLVGFHVHGQIHVCTCCGFVKTLTSHLPLKISTTYSTYMFTSVYHKPSVNLAIQETPFFAVKEPGMGGLAASSFRNCCICCSNCGPVNKNNKS